MGHGSGGVLHFAEQTDHDVVTMDLSTLYKTQISLTEWFQRMGLANTEAHRKEDNDKRERLAILNELFDLPFDRPTQFAVTEIVNSSPRFVEFLETRGEELCALRLIPIDPVLPKLRTRGASIAESMKWFALQDIDPEKYKADFVPHPSDHVWSTIFVVNQHGTFGQIVAGSHNQLTQGFYDEGTEPITFSWNASSIQTNPKNANAEAHLLDAIGMLRVTDPAVREKLEAEFDAKFFGEYLCGYFETASSKQFGTWFIDWNRILGETYANEVTDERFFACAQNDGGEIGDRSKNNNEDIARGVKTSVILNESEGSPVGLLRGQIGSRGSVTGRARVIRAADIAGADIEPGDILVTDMTTPDFLPLMMKAGGVVTAWGGILCHAAIVCRELGKPCVTNVKGILETIQDGDVVEVDATRGTVKVISRA